MGEKCGKMTKNFLNPEIFPQTASERLVLFSCLSKVLRLERLQTKFLFPRLQGIG